MYSTAQHNTAQHKRGLQFPRYFLSTRSHQMLEVFLSTFIPFVPQRHDFLLHSLSLPSLAPFRLTTIITAKQLAIVFGQHRMQLVAKKGATST